MVEEVTSLKKDFKQKENKYLEEFLDMKALKEKVEDKLYKQDQSLQTVHMLCKPKPYYNEQNKIAIGYKNPLCLTRAKQVQPALYNGYEIIKNNHVLTLVHNTEDTLEIAEITRRKMNDKMKDPECVTHKVKIAPPDYSKENYLATFTPQKQLTPEQIFWSQDLMKKEFEHEHVVMNPTSAGMRHHHLHLYIQRISLTGFPAQSVGSSNTDVLDLPCLLVLITGTSQSRQHVDTSLIHIESRKSPTAVLFDDDTGRISIRHCEY
ncbi:hypothetical protein Tco_0708194 [Tanacetum coccineum]